LNTFVCLFRKKVRLKKRI